MGCAASLRRKFARQTALKVSEGMLVEEGQILTLLD
jgi:hypothetical protein